MRTPPEISSALSDRYVIEREIGAGGMATVYLARVMQREYHADAWLHKVIGE